MKSLKKTIALIAVLAMTATSMVGCGGGDDSSSNNTSNNTTTAANDSADDSSSSDDDTSTDADSDSSSDSDSDTDTSGDSSSTDYNVEATLPSDGANFVINSWNDEFIGMLKNYYCDNGEFGYDNGGPVQTGAKYDEASDTITFSNGVTCAIQTDYLIKPSDGGAYQTNLDQILSSNGDLGDMFLAEADYALKYINNDNATTPLSAVGLGDSAFDKQYEYTKQVGTSKMDSSIKGSSWQAAPGLFLYRPSLAQELLGVADEAAMQEKVKDWDTFIATAKEVNTASNGAVKLIQGVQDVWQVFRTNRTTSWIDGTSLAVTDEIDHFMDIAYQLTNSDGQDLTVGVNQWTNGWNSCISDSVSDASAKTMGAFFSTWGIQWTMVANCGGEKGAEGSSYGDWKAIEGPSAYYWGGTWIVVPPTCNNADIAKSIIEFFTVNTESMEWYAKNSSDYCNNDEAISNIIASGYSFDFLGGQDHYSLFQEQVKNIDVSTMTGYDQTINNAFIEAVNSYCYNGTSKEDAIKSFKGAVKDQIAGITVE
ncbi:MAG: hypothetical protein ACI4WH_06505 [Oscillospiraceae bacterium]